MNRPGALAAWVLVACGVLGACGDSSTGLESVPPTVQIGVEGQLERSAMIGLTASVDGTTLAPDAVSWRAEPAAAVEFIDATSARLLEAGAVTLFATSDGAAGSRELDVAAPPRIVFDMRIDGNRDVFAVALDGLDLVRLTSDPIDDVDPTAAAGQVVFTSFRDGNAELYGVSIDGGPATRLTDSPGPDKAAALSPDGGELVFIRGDGGLERVWRANADLSNARRAFGDFGPGSAVESTPAWSSDGTRVAFMSTAAGNADVYEVVLATETVTPVADDVAPDFEPTYESGGLRVVFASERSGDVELYRGAAGETPVRITSRSGADSQPTVLPDGRIVWTADGSSGTELRWMDPDDSATVQVIPLPAGSEPGNPAAVLP